jgi:hypothetical protein
MWARRKMMKKIVNKIRNEQGQALPIILILMVIGGLIIAPLLSYISSGLVAGQTYEAIADELYAADAGVEDGLWQISYNHLDDLITSYDEYDFDTEFAYPSSYPVRVNNIDVDVTIENVWVPDIDEPDSISEAHSLIGTGKLMITGNIPEENTHQIKIYYYPDESDSADFYVNTIGIWIPPGFSYNTTVECTLETYLSASGKSYSRDIYPHCGGEAVVWTLTDVLFDNLPGANRLDNPMASTIEFQYTAASENRTPEAIAWMTTSGVSDIPYTWDADVKVYHIQSVAEGTTVEAYAIKTELRQLGSAIAGDYRAIGNTLMTDEHYDSGGPKLDTLWSESDATASDIPSSAHVEAAFLYWSGWVEGEEDVQTYFEDFCNNMNQWYPDSNWSAVRQGGNWVFQGHGSGYLEMQDSVDLSSCKSGTATISWQQSVAGNRLDNYDCLKFQLSNDGGSTWGSLITAFCRNPSYNYEYLIPDEYLTDNFKMRFYLDGFSGRNEYCYLDNIRIRGEEEQIIADTSIVFKINGVQVYFADDAYGNPTVPTEGSEEITTNKYQVLQNVDGSGNPHGYSYASFKDVTGLLQEYANQGNATYTVGEVYGDTGDEWSYAAWSLIIIYASPETRGHQLYLYDITNSDFIYVENDGTLKYPISGFLVPDPIAGETTAATITCFIGEGDDYYANDFISFNPPDSYDTHPQDIPNRYKLWDGTYSDEHPGSNTPSSPNNVWNSKSLGLSEDGIDIDTFYVPWGDPPENGLLKPQDTSAVVVLHTGTDSWNFIYIILSFRSDTVTGGTVTYLIWE